MDSQQTPEKFDHWAIVEIMGHQRIAGRVSEETIAGASYLRVDVPQVEDLKAFTKYFGTSAIYAITPVSEEIARAMVLRFQERPVQEYELPPDLQKRLPLEATCDDESPLW